MAEVGGAPLAAGVRRVPVGQGAGFAEVWRELLGDDTPSAAPDEVGTLPAGTGRRHSDSEKPAAEVGAEPVDQESGVTEDWPLRQAVEPRAVPDQAIGPPEFAVAVGEAVQVKPSGHEGDCREADTGKVRTKDDQQDPSPDLIAALVTTQLPVSNSPSTDTDGGDAASNPAASGTSEGSVWVVGSVQGDNPVAEPAKGSGGQLLRTRGSAWATATRSWSDAADVPESIVNEMGAAALSERSDRVGRIGDDVGLAPRWEARTLGPEGLRRGDDWLKQLSGFSGQTDEAPPAVAVASPAGTGTAKAAAGEPSPGGGGLQESDVAAPQTKLDRSAEFRIGEHASPDSGSISAVPTGGGADASIAGWQPDGRPIVGMASAAQVTAQAPPSAVNAVAVAIAHHVDTGIRHFTVRLDPPDLGAVEVRLRFGRDGSLRARINSHRGDTLALLAADPASLRQALDAAGVPGAEIDFGRSAGDDGAFRQDRQAQAPVEDWNGRNDGGVAPLSAPVERTVRSIMVSDRLDIII